MIRFRALLALLGCLCAVPVQAGPGRAPYNGATVTMVVSASTGGGYDTLARAIARQLGKHIPGHPTIVVRNMPGAGGIIATNYLYSVAPHDGSVLGLIQSDPPLEPLFGSKQAQFDPLKFNWLGTPSVETAMVLVWHTVPVNSVNDLRKRVTEMGASGANSTPAFYAKLLNATLGTKMKVIPAYPGQNDAFLAMERGELDGYPSVFYSALTSTRQRWLADKKARAIVQYGPEKLAALSDVPFGPDLVTDPQDKQLMQVAVTPLALGRPLLMPPGVPADRVATMRQALMATFADPAFLEDAKKIGLQVNSPREGDQLVQVIERAYRAPPQIIERLRKLNEP